MRQLATVVWLAAVTLKLSQAGPVRMEERVVQLYQKVDMLEVQVTGQREADYCILV